jgi:hypothetical protein
MFIELEDFARSLVDNEGFGKVLSRFRFSISEGVTAALIKLR